MHHCCLIPSIIRAFWKRGPVCGGSASTLRCNRVPFDPKKVDVEMTLASPGIRIVASLVTVLALWLPCSAEAGTAAPSTVLVGGQPCQVLPVSRVTHVVPDGSMTPSTASDAATVTWFDDNGFEIPEPTPARGWTPLTASASQLAFFGLPPRPANPAQLADWEASWANYSGFEVNQQPCITPFHTVLPSAPANDTVMPGMAAQQSAATGAAESAATPDCSVLTCSPNWAGLVDTDGASYTEAYARTTIQSENNSCSPDDAHADWVGLGGWGSSQLLQNGVGSAGNVTGFFAWWEAIDGTDDTHQVRESMALSAGDVVSMSTTYNPSAETVTFSWHNQTTGQLATVGPMFSIPVGGGVMIFTSRFFDGTKAEAIDERTEVGGNYDKIRDFGTQTWDQARVYSNGSSSYSGMRTVPHIGPTMTNEAQTQTLVSVTGDTTEAFHDTWQQCGSVEPAP